MTISKTKNGTYRLKVYIPLEARMPLGIVNNNYYDKRFKTRKEARQAEIDLLTKLNQIEDNIFSELGKEDILFSDFYNNIWWESYKAGQQLLIPKHVLKSIYYHFLATIRFNF